MRKTLSRLVFAFWMVSAPLALVGCSEGDKAAAPAPDAGAPAPDPDAGAAPAPTPAPEPPK